MWGHWTQLLPIAAGTTVFGIPRTRKAEGNESTAWTETATGIGGAMCLQEVHVRVLPTWTHKDLPSKSIR